MADDITLPGTGGIVATDEVSSKHYQRVKLTAGADGIAADSGTYSVSANFTRPANTTAYAIGDLVANNTTAGSVAPLSFAITSSLGTVRRIRVKYSDIAVSTPPTLRVWLFEASPTVTNGDNGIFLATLTASVGYVDVDVTSVGSDAVAGWSSCDVPVASATIYALLGTQTAFTPASGATFTVNLWYLAG